EGVSCGKMIVAGIQFEFLRSRREVEEAMNVALEKGSNGICIFLYPLQHPELKDAVKEAFSKF
ncbi:MAG: hypothetical protein QW797_03105, partial [Thermoproteota archaeon]